MFSVQKQKPRRRLRTSQRGQVILIVVLIMTVVLTVGLSVATRTITNLRVTEEEEQSQRAFSAAEAGIEQALKSGQGLENLPLGNNATISQVTINQVQGATLLMNNGNPVLKNDGVDVWLSTYPDYSDPRFSGELTIYWGKPEHECDQSPQNNSQAALEIVVLSGTPAAPQATHHVFDGCPARRNANNFTAAVNGGTLNSVTYQNSQTITINSGMIARITPLYAATPIAIQASPPLPAQGDLIESVGVSGESQQKISLFRGYPKLPNELFMHVLLVP